ncbi:hypothetical protein Z043_111790 [Scleropages formosus]|uniref:SH3 domain-containing protein n=1 Tax=Scleropages formosus TaxID=113540 RepID=A0A0P7X5Q8_SCLFO|nr:hypothetical protein Z043_111790 [Scleropages formosus]
MISGAFKRNFSSPLLVNDQLGVVKEASSNLESGKPGVDPVYEALRYGTSLAQMSRSSFGSISESPTRSVSDEGENQVSSQSMTDEKQPSQETGALSAALESEKTESEDRDSVKAPKRIEVHSIHTYVALYKFLPQEKNDLELHPGDRVQVTDDSNEDWWKRVKAERQNGSVLSSAAIVLRSIPQRKHLWLLRKLSWSSLGTQACWCRPLPAPRWSESACCSLTGLAASRFAAFHTHGKSRDKVGFFPANFVQRVRPGERVWRVTQGFHGNREKGQMTVKESQVCVGKNDIIDGFLRLSSGKKRGLVPYTSLEEI